MPRSLFHAHLPQHCHTIILIIVTYYLSLRHRTHLHCCADARSSSLLQLHMHRNVFPFPGTLFGNRKLFPYFTGHYPLTISRPLILHSFFLLSTSCSANKSALAVRASSLSHWSNTHLFIVAPVARPSSSLHQSNIHLYPCACCVLIFIVALVERPSLLPHLSRAYLHCHAVKVAQQFIVAPLRLCTQFIAPPSRSCTSLLLRRQCHTHSFIAAPLRLRARLLTRRQGCAPSCRTVEVARSIYCSAIKVAHSVYRRAIKVARQFIVAPSWLRTQFIVTPSRLRTQSSHRQGCALSLLVTHRVAPL